MRLTKNRMDLGLPLVCLSALWGLSTGLSSCSTFGTKIVTHPISANVNQTQSGTLAFTANGEDFVRDGLISRDQWQVSFDHVYVNFEQITTAQKSMSSSSDGAARSKTVHPVRWDGSKTIDLAAEETPVISTVPAPIGQYQQLSWKLSPASTGPAKGASLLLKGKATKQDQVVPFTLRLDPTLSFRCGAYVGDERKGILKADKTAELEATFHFDHLFGNGDAPPDDEVNRDSLGFEPLATLAQSNPATEILDVDMDMLLAQFSPEDSAKLMAILPHLGHVGEGHCEANL